MAEWGNPSDTFANNGFGNIGGGGSGNGSFGNRPNFSSKANKSSSFKPSITTSNSNSRPTTSTWNTPAVSKSNNCEHGDWSNHLNKMIGAHNIPFFGQTQAFMGRTLWDCLKKPKAYFSDCIDRLNCQLVPTVLLFFVAVISVNIFGFGGMEPMKCLRSQELSDEEREYAIDYCNSKNQYYVAPEEGIPWSNPDRRARQLGYYHWVPIMLFLQALVFYLPNWLWNHLSQQSGIEYVKFIEESTKLKGMGLAPIEERNELISQLKDKLSEAILNRDPVHRRIVGCRFGQSMGSYVSWLYVFIKLLYLANVTIQFLVLNAFIGRDYRWWGWEVLKALINGENWQDSPVFPRLTLCDVPIRRLGDTPRYTLQCHLRINTYNEKIYLFIWWGFLLVSTLTLFNFLYYLVVLILLPCTQESSVRHLLKQEKHRHIVYSNAKHQRKMITKFAEHVLRKDGVLLFWFIEGHAGPIVARELMGELFDLYRSDIHEDDPSEVDVPKQAKGSFSTQSTGSLDDDNWGGGGAGINQRFANGIAPSAPPKFMPEASSFASSQERELVDGDLNATEQTDLYSSTPKQGRPHHHHRGHGHRMPPYSDNLRRGGLLSSVFRRLGSAVLGTHHGNPYGGASYYGRTPIKNV